MRESDVTTGQLGQFFEIRATLARYDMRGLHDAFQTLLDAHKGRSNSHRVKPAFALWQLMRLPEYSGPNNYFDDYLESIPADKLVVSSARERTFRYRVLVDPRYQLQHFQQHGSVSIETGMLLDAEHVTVSPKPYWIACGFVDATEALRYISEAAKDGTSQLVRSMTALEGLAWFRQCWSRPTLPTKERRFRLAGSVGTMADLERRPTDLVICYPRVSLALASRELKRHLCGICLVERTTA